MHGKQAMALGAVLFSMSIGVLGLCASVAQADAETTQVPAVSAESKNGWDQGRQHYYENGEMVRSREIYDRQDGNWYWIDGDGTVARNKDVYLRSNGGKWVRYDANGHMIKGEDYRYGGWYYFDRHTGAMAKGMTFVPSNGGKWVYYDWITGKMAYGERLVNYDAAHTGWYHFDEHTGAMTHGFYYNASQHKWVCYDPVSGQMLHGQHAVNGHWYDFDDTTGAVKYGFVYHAKQQKWVFYDRRMGWMLYGEQPIDGAWYLLDANTGAVRYGWQWVGGKHVCYDWPSGKMLYGWHSVNGAIWFLLALFWAHLLLHAFAKLPYTPVWVVSSFAIGYISARYVWLPWSLQSGMCAVAFVYVGYLAKRYDLMGHVKRFPWLWGVAGVIWVVAIVRFGGMSMAINNYGTRPVQAVIGSLAGTLCVIGISKLLDHVPALGRALSWTGQSSLAILCVHLVEDDVLPWQMYLGVLHNLLPHIPLTVTSFVVRLPIDLAFAALLYYVPVVNEWFYPQLAKRRQAAA